VANSVSGEADNYQSPVGEVPNLLPIELMHFGNIGGRTFKRSEEVRDVSLSVYADRPNDVHVLRAFVVHHGAWLETGHYTRGSASQGWHYNDPHVVARDAPVSTIYGISCLIIMNWQIV
jgi:hypothetical protein